MYLKRVMTLGAVALALTACDKDPSAPSTLLTLTACPAGDLAVNAPVNLNFTAPVRPSTVSAANIVITNASNGIEIPGSLALQPNGTQVRFTPSSPLPFGTVLGIRVQNLVSVDGSTPLSVVVCNVRTQAPPIAEVVWQRLENPTGNQLVGASMYSADSGWVASIAVPLFRRTGTGWTVGFNQPYFAESYDVDFLSRTHGFASHLDVRVYRGVITRTNNGLTFDTVFTRDGESINRLHIDSLVPSGKLFGVAGGGTVGNATFLKFNPATGGFFVTNVFNNPTFDFTSNVADIDFVRGDTTNGVAVSTGNRFNSSSLYLAPGRVFRTTNGGASWAEIGRAADTNTVTYQGVARRTTGDIYVSGGLGYFARLTANGATTTKINLGLIPVDTTDYTSLIYNDVQFAPDNNLIGWVVGAQFVGIVNGVPKYQGVIFGTKDGGTTWTRQGVIGANNYGAEFPPLTRIEAFSSTKVWIVGDGGTVLSLNP